MSSDPDDITRHLDEATQAFELGLNHGQPAYEEGVSRDQDWRTQFTKACRYLAGARTLRGQDGHYGAVIELCFGAIERTLESYILWQNPDESIEDYTDHEAVYDRALHVGLLDDRETAEEMKDLYSRNRVDHYYGGRVPTEAQEDAMYALATELHDFTSDKIRDGGFCLC